MLPLYYEYSFQFLQVANRDLYFHTRTQELPQRDKVGVLVTVCSYDRNGQPIILQLKIGEYPNGEDKNKDRERLMHLATETQNAFKKFCDDRYILFHSDKSPVPIEVYFIRASIEEHTGYRYKNFIHPTDPLALCNSCLKAYAHVELPNENDKGTDDDLPF
ncbi:MAG: hypothetical protein R3E32_03850 [Chitinophagales bacterium]